MNKLRYFGYLVLFQNMLIGRYKENLRYSLSRQRYKMGEYTLKINK
jgi:hypothetical protein